MKSSHKICLTRPSKSIALAVLFCGLVSLSFLILRGPDLIFPDERSYFQLAQSLINQGAYLNEEGLPTSYRPPGYPILLAPIVAISQNLWWVKLNGVIAMMITATLAALLTEKSAPGYGWISAGLVAIYPLAQYTSTTLYPQIWAGALFLAVVYLLSCQETPHARIWLLSGLLYGFLILMVPSFLLLLVAFFGPSLLFLHPKVPWKRQAMHCALFAITAASIVLPWTARNFLRFDSFIPVSNNSGISLLAGNSPGATHNSGVNEYLIQRVQAYDHLNEIEAGKALTQEALTWIKENKAAAGRLYLSKVLNYFNYRNDLYVASEGGSARWLLVAVSYYPLLLLTGIRFLWIQKFSARRIEWLLLATYVINAPLSAIFFTRLRFRVPFDFMLIILASISLSMLWKVMQTRYSRNVTQT